MDDLRLAKWMRHYSVPILILYVTAVVVVLFIDLMGLIPVMASLSLLLVVLGHEKYRSLRGKSTDANVHRLLRLEYACEWLDALLLTGLTIVLLTVESSALWVGLFFATWGLLDASRQRWIDAKIGRIDPDMPTYKQLIERRDVS